MECPKCDGAVRVVDVVHTLTNTTIRKRTCKVCNYKFYTVEKEVPITGELLDAYNRNYRT